MAEENVKVYKTSIFPDENIQHVEESQYKLSSVYVVVFLLIIFFVLKKFIYIKDDKRHGK